MTKRILVEFRHKKYPFIKVIEYPKKKQVLLAFNSNTSHITLHEDSTGIIIYTLWSNNKPVNNYDKRTADTAREIGYKNWKRHSYYYAHEPIIFSEVNGYNWGKLLVDFTYNLCDLEIKDKHYKDPYEICEISSELGNCIVYFGGKTDFKPRHFEHISSTFLGTLYFTFNRSIYD